MDDVYAELDETNMIDRVAAKIMKDAAVGELLWDAAGEARRERFRRAARAALEALREPTDDMIYVGEGYCDFMLPSTHDNTGDGRRKEFRMGWQAAIDHALNPQSQP